MQDILHSSFRKLCATINSYPIFSTRYSVMPKVYTGYHGTSEIEHVCVPVRLIIPAQADQNLCSFAQAQYDIFTLHYLRENSLI